MVRKLDPSHPLAHAVGLLDVPNVRAATDARCDVCDCLIPAGQFFGDVDGTRCCTASCVAVMLPSTSRLESEADVLRDEVRKLKSVADEARRRAEECEDEASDAEDDWKSKKRELDKVLGRGGGRFFPEISAPVGEARFHVPEPEDDDFDEDWD